MEFRKLMCLAALVFATQLGATQVRAAASPIEVSGQPFVARYSAPSGDATRPGVLVLGGSEGGIPDRLAAPLIEAGMPVLSLAYFKAPGLPAELEKIPLEYFEPAKHWLLAQPGVDPERLIVVAWSKGAELALLLAARDPRIQRVLAVAPSSVVWAGILEDWSKVPDSSWTEHGKPLAHVPFRPSGEVKGLLDLYTQSLANRDDAQAADIPVERITADVILLTGAEDEIWPSPAMASSVCTRMQTQASGSCKHIRYEGLDHLLDYRMLDASSPMHDEFLEHLQAPLPAP